MIGRILFSDFFDEIADAVQGFFLREEVNDVKGGYCFFRLMNDFAELFRFFDPAFLLHAF